MAKERIAGLLEMKKCSLREVADGSEARRIMYENQVRGNALLKFDLLYRLAYMFHDISCEWLLLGDGHLRKADYLGNQHVRVENHGDSHNNGDAIIHVGDNSQYIIDRYAIAERDQIIARLKQQVAELQHDKELSQRVIESLIAAQKK